MLEATAHRLRKRRHRTEVEKVQDMLHKIMT